LPRSFKRDEVETLSRSFSDPRSFCSLPKAIPACPNEIHDLLAGEVDKGRRRREIYDRAHGRCEIQISPRCRGFASWEDGEWCHKAKKPWERCDCAEAARWGCKPCHRLEHSNRRPRFGEA